MTSDDNDDPYEEDFARPHTKKDIDRFVSALIDMPDVNVSLVTRAFLDRVGDLLAHGVTVRLTGLGSLQWKGYGREQPGTNVKPGWTIRLIKDEKLKNRFAKARRETMEKYGVSEKDHDKLEKLAADGCPECGSKNVERIGSILKCPNCGTAPFEKRK